MSLPSFPPVRDGIVRVPARGAVAEVVHVLDEDSIAAVEMALATGRPLLVRGEPGTGKTQLAAAVAHELKRALLTYTVDARTETRDLLWTLDAVARLAEAQVLGTRHGLTDAEIEERIRVGRFVHPGTLWWALDWKTAHEQATLAKSSVPVTSPEWKPEHGVVALVDEIDKADASVPNGLLDAMGSGRFEVPGRAAVEVGASSWPLVIFTTNEERTLPDAFLRRCLVLHLRVPEVRAELITWLEARGRAHFRECAPEVLRKAAELLAHDREKYHQQNLAPPGVAEYIDLLRGVTRRRPGDVTAQLDLLNKVGKFVLCKHPGVAPR
jgi:MoxR-like ATPase